MKVNIKTLAGNLIIDLPNDSTIEDFKKIIAKKLNTEARYVILKYYNLDDHLQNFFDLNEHVDISSPNIQIFAIINQSQLIFHITIHDNEPFYDDVNNLYMTLPPDGLDGLNVFISNEYEIPFETVNDYVNINDNIEKIIQKYGLNINLDQYDFIRSDIPKKTQSFEDGIYFYMKKYEKMIENGVSFHMVRNRNYFEMIYPEIFPPKNNTRVSPPSGQLEIPKIQVSFKHKNKK